MFSIAIASSRVIGTLIILPICSFIWLNVLLEPDDPLEAKQRLADSKRAYKMRSRASKLL